MIGLVDMDATPLGDLDRIDQIVSMSSFDGGGAEPTCRIMLAGGDTSRKVRADTYRRIVAYPLQLLPAQAGTYALGAYFETGTAEVLKTPVIAWARCFDGSIRIVTPQGVDDGHLWKDGGGYVLTPDGSVQAVGEQQHHAYFESVDAYLAYKKAERDDRREARA